MPRRVVRLFALSMFARLPLAAVGLLFIVRTRELTGSYAASGIVAGVASIANAVSAPLLGRMVDRRGQTVVLHVSAAVAAAALLGFASLPDGTVLAAPVVLAGLYGIASPPLGTCLRTLYPALLDADRVHRAYALESAALELTYIAGPLGLLGIAAAAGTVTALLVAAGVLGAGTIAFAAARESRAWRPAPAAADGSRRPTLHSPGLRTVILAVGLAGATFGAIEVAVPAACQAAHATSATGALLAMWGLGSMLGGIAAARANAPTDGARWLALMLAALGIGDLALVPITSPSGLAPLLLLAGAAIAPLLATASSIIARLAPAGRSTEAFAWMSTAIGLGLAAGSSLAGALVDAAGPSAGFAVAAVAGLVACATTSARRASLPDPLAA